MIAYKFLARGAIGPFSRFAWPVAQDGQPGAWVEATPNPCATGIHACTVDDLPWWLHEELWEIELDGPAERAGHKLVAPRGRLVRRVTAWDRDAMRAFCESCAERVEDYARRSKAAAEYLVDMADDIERVLAPTASDDASRAAEAAGGARLREAERVAQAQWLVTRLGLRA